MEKQIMQMAPAKPQRVTVLVEHNKGGTWGVRVPGDGEHSIAEPCRREGIYQNLYYRWSKEFIEAGKKHLAGDTAREAMTTTRKIVSKSVLRKSRHD